MIENSSPKVWVIVPAAGVGARMGAGLPKQYLPLQGQTVIEQTLSVLAKTPYLAELVVCLHSEDRNFQKLGIDPLSVRTTAGGSERSDSVLSGLEFFKAKATEQDWVLVHDAARPCLSEKLLNEFVQNVMTEGQGGVLAVPVADTLKLVEVGTQRVVKTQDRANLWQAQTPQMFKFHDLLSALKRAKTNSHPVTDEASAMEFAGMQVSVFPGSSTNIKITHPQDLGLARLILQANS